MIKIALNGGKPKTENPNLPTSFEEYKKEIDWFQAHGLHDFHIHFRDPEGQDTLLQKYVQPQWEALKIACPGCRIGIGSPLLFGRTHEKRMEEISAWTWKPDYISLNIPEEGSNELAQLLIEKKVPIEYSCFTIDDALVFEKQGYADSTFRVLVEVSGEKDGQRTVDKAVQIYQYLDDRYPHLEYVIHGEDIYTWDVIHYAKAFHLNWRIGMEDISCDEHGHELTSNVALYRHALEI